MAGVSAGMILQGQIIAGLVADRSLHALTAVAMSTAFVGSAGVLVVALAGAGTGLWVLSLALVVATVPLT